MCARWSESRCAENSLQVAKKRQLRVTSGQPTRPKPHPKHEFDVLAAIAFLRERKMHNHEPIISELNDTYTNCRFTLNDTTTIHPSIRQKETNSCGVLIIDGVHAYGCITHNRLVSTATPPPSPR